MGEIKTWELYAFQEWKQILVLKHDQQKGTHCFVHYFIELTVILFHNFMFHIIQLYTPEPWHLSSISIFTSPEENLLWIYKQFHQQWSWWSTPNHTIGKKIVFLNNNASLFYLNTSALMLKHWIWNALCYLRPSFFLFFLLFFYPQYFKSSCEENLLCLLCNFILIQGSGNLANEK